MQAVAEATGPGIELFPQLWKKDPQFLGILRKIGAVEAGGVSHPCDGSQRKQLQVAGGVAPALQSTLLALSGSLFYQRVT